MLQIVDSENRPLRVFFGDAPLAIATADYESRLATWREWEPVSVAAHGQNDWVRARRPPLGPPVLPQRTKS